MNAIATRALARRYRSIGPGGHSASRGTPPRPRWPGAPRGTWALRDCNLVIPAGRVVALVGPNGAGKTTLLGIAAGLLRPTSGDLTVLDGCRPGSAAARAGIGFVAQDAALYKHLPARDMVAVAAKLNDSFAEDWALARLKELRIALRQKVGALSAGQRAQLALTLAIAKRPHLGVLAGTVARRTVPAVVGTIVSYVALFHFWPSWRPYYLPPVHHIYQLPHANSASVFPFLLINPGQGVGQPYSRLGLFQCLELGWLAVASAALVAAAIALIRRRSA